MTKTTTTTDAVFKPQEVAFRKPGRTWKRRVAKTEAEFTRLIEKLQDEGAAIEVRDAEV